MSPEQIQHGTIDGRADIYSLGITFYEMITGTVPFAAESEFGIMKKHLEEQPQPPSHFNPEITKVQNELILHAMAKAPGERFADAKDFAEAIHDALSLGDTTSPGTKPKVKPITDKKPPASVKETSVEPPGPGPQHREQRPQAYARKTSFKPGWIVYPLLVAAAAVIGYMVFSPRPEPELPPIIVEQDADTGSDSALTKNEDTMVTPLRDTQTIIAEIPEKPVDTQQVVIHEPHSEPPPPAAVLTINATPLNRRAEITGIWLDGRRVASAAPYTISRLDRGLHWIKVESTFGTWTDTVTWAGNDRDLDFFLTENSSGRINIAAVFPDGENNADIFIDDVDIGFWTPHSKPGLPAGPHKIEVRKDGYQAVGGPRLVRLETGEKATVRFEMRQR